MGLPRAWAPPRCRGRGRRSRPRPVGGPCYSRGQGILLELLCDTWLPGEA